MIHTVVDPPRYVVGIDLGTSHTVAVYADTARGAAAEIDLFPIEQLVGPGEVASRALLPSIRYHPAPGELKPEDTRLPWTVDSVDASIGPVFGEWARVLGAKSHGRLVASAKSWLSHTGVDRTAAILPWGAPDEVPKISPLSAGASYLSYLRSAWNERFPADLLEDQDLVVTVPASFDEGPRTLTLEAARMAGLPRLRLVEEPQAACYDWLWQHRHTALQELADVRLILVCDVGGGTTDFTLIRVDHGEGEPRLTRIGVGNHLMLGGDNMDLALAHRVEDRLGLTGRRVTATELAQLVDQCRAAKELLLAPDAPAQANVTLLGAGARLIGAARTVAVEREELRALVLDGFFPRVGPQDFPERRRSGVVEFGLPYVADPAVTRHMAAFLDQHRQVAQEAAGAEDPLPDAVLFNGGAFGSPAVGERVIDLLTGWAGRTVRALRNDRPDQAVAFGAAAYALAKRGFDLQKIGGGSPRSYFLQVDTNDSERLQGVCVLPRGSDEGREIDLPERRFLLTLGQPVRFTVFSSTDDTIPRPGDVVSCDPERFVELPPLTVALDPVKDGSGEAATEVRLAASMTEVGTLELRCIACRDPSRFWRLEFLVRTGAKGVQARQSRIHPRLRDAQEEISRIFGKKSKGEDPKAVRALRSVLERQLGPRGSWDSTLCRDLFMSLLEGLPHRRRSAEHERLWLNLTGFCLRPGFGDPLDAWRAQQLWTIYPAGLQFVGESQNWAEWWTLWRRVSGGLSAEAQLRIFADIAPFVDPAAHRRGTTVALAKARSYEDMVRLAGSLERLEARAKTELGQWLLERLGKPGEPMENGWALGRVGSRVPLYGSAHAVVPRIEAERWLQKLLVLDWRKNVQVALAATLIARMSGDRERDVDPEVRAEVVAKLRSAKAPESWVSLVSQVWELDAAEEKRILGDALPPGLRLLA